MKKWVRIIVAFLATLGVILVIAFISYNIKETATIHLLFARTDVPVYLLVGISVLIGAAIPSIIRILLRILRRKKTDKE